MFNCSIENYFMQNFTWPLLMMLLALLSLGYLAINIFKWLHSSKKPKKSIIILRTVLTIIISLPLLIHYNAIFSRGIYLPFEEARDGREYIGVVTRIEPEKHSPQYFLEEYEGILRASFVTVDDNTFYFITAAGLDVGDRIRIVYLPKSKMVLCCESAP